MATWTQDVLFFRNYNIIEDLLLSKILNIFIDQPNLSENEVMALLPDDYYLNIETDTFRKLLLLATNRPFQIERLISYYNQQRTTLAKVDHQTFFKFLFFELNLLPEALERRPELYFTINKFIAEGLKQSESMNDVKGCIFYLNLAHHVNKEFIYLQETLKDNKKLSRAVAVQKEIASLSPPKEIERLLNQKGLSNDEVSLLYQELLCIAPDYLSNEPKLLFLALKGMGHLKNHPVRNNTGEEEIILSTSDYILQKFIHESIMKDPIATLTAFCSFDDKISQLIPQKKWDFNDYPICRSTDASIIIDITNAEVFLNNHERRELTGPAKILLPEGCYIPGTIADIHDNQDTAVYTINYDHPNGMHFQVFGSGKLNFREIERTTTTGKCLRYIKTLPIPQTISESCQLWFD
jgi:hypothetical protein